MTVVPVAVLTSLMTSRSIWASAIARWPVMVPLNDVRGAVSGAAIAVPSRARPMVPTTPFTVGASRPNVWNGRVVLVTSARPNSSRWPGSCGHAFFSSWAPSGSASGSRLHRCEIRLAPETPSTVAWCIFWKTAIRSRPSSSRSIVALDHPHLPQRAGAVERQAGEVAGQVGELGVPARRRQRQPVHVPLDVELVVADPDRVVEPERDPAQLAREVRYVADPAFDAVAHRGERVRLRHRGRVEHDQPAHVHELRRRLEVEEARVEPRQPVHLSLPSTGVA